MAKIFLFAFVSLFIVLNVNCGLTSLEIFKQEWEEFKAFYGKVYNSVESEAFRFKIFMENKFKISRHNELAAKKQVNFTLRMNEYGDLLHHEFKQMMNGYKFSANQNRSETSIEFLEPLNYIAPYDVDWRKEGYVTPVKNQGHCGSCWAFSTTGSLEGQHKRKTKKLVSLSEQQLVDCASKFGNNGCNGGLMDNAFQYIKKNGGIDTEESYSYKAEDGVCKFNKKNVGATCTGFVDIPSGSEKKLKLAVSSVGPVSVAIDAGHESFQFYSNGVYDEKECGNEAESLDHGVLVVGYGVEDDQNYWLVKNSWGETWGMDGYIKMSRDKDNQCGIATTASYPTV